MADVGYELQRDKIQLIVEGARSWYSAHTDCFFAWKSTIEEGEPSHSVINVQTVVGHLKGRGRGNNNFS